MVLRKSANNVELIVDIAPNPLGGQQGTHWIWFNNNNPWTASVTPAYIAVQNAASAQLDLLVSGTRLRHRGVAIGYLGAWRSSRPIPTGLAEVAGATSSGEIVDVTCSISRTIPPGLPPPRLYPLQISALVSL